MGMELSEFRWELTSDSSQEWDRLSDEKLDIFTLFLFESRAGERLVVLVRRMVDILVSSDPGLVFTELGDRWALFR